VAFTILTATLTQRFIVALAIKYVAKLVSASPLRYQRPVPIGDPLVALLLATSQTSLWMESMGFFQAATTLEYKSNVSFSFLFDSGIKVSFFHNENRTVSLDLAVTLAGSYPSTTQCTNPLVDTYNSAGVCYISSSGNPTNYMQIWVQDNLATECSTALIFSGLSCRTDILVCYVSY